MKERKLLLSLLFLLCTFYLQEALQNKQERLNAKMMAEQEVTSFQGQLTSVRKALAKSLADNDELKKELHKQVSEFNRF